MRTNLLTMSAAFAILSAGSLVSISAQAGSTANGAAAKSSHAVAVHHRHHLRTAQHAIQPNSDITSFSSSSVLNVGVNHPPKK
jgi:hypothetical protein